MDRRLRFRGIWGGAFLAFLNLVAWTGAKGPPSAVVALDHSAGLFHAPFSLHGAVSPGLEAFFTTDGSFPLPGSSRRWSGALAVTNTLILRLACYRGNTAAGPCETRTFLFPEFVVAQDGAGFPDSWGRTNQEPVRAYYPMSRAVTQDPAYRPLLVPALESIPTLSIVMDRDDLFGADKGIYAHPLESGLAWERPASVEWMEPDGGPGFQMDCGIRVQGGWNRRPEESPKHAFRLVFHHRYGENHLVFPVFGAKGAQEFETLILRAGCNNTWLHWSGEERHRGDYLRDQWMRDTLRAMGHPSARGRFVHLYLDGLYWGLYDLSERPSAPFVAAQLGGRPKDYDVRNADHILEGTDHAWKELLALADAGIGTAAQYQAVSSLLDVPEFIDYMLANFYGANGDWDRSSNWYAARRRKPPGSFQFFVWDGERTLETVDANILDTDDDQSPLRLFQKLRAWPEFRRAFAQRAHAQLRDGGALSPGQAAARFRVLANGIDLAIVAESARWGDYRRDFHPYKSGPYELYTRDTHWRPEVQRLLNEYFPRRSDVFQSQLQSAGLW